MHDGSIISWREWLKNHFLYVHKNEFKATQSFVLYNNNILNFKLSYIFYLQYVDSFLEWYGVSIILYGDSLCLSTTVWSEWFLTTIEKTRTDSRWLDFRFRKIRVNISLHVKKLFSYLVYYSISYRNILYLIYFW